jgi:hypothetical protein
MRDGPKKKESSLPMLIGIITLFGIGYVLGSPAVAQYLPRSMERPFVKLNDETNKAFQGIFRMVGLG